jgi:hypothetical protein
MNINKVRPPCWLRKGKRPEALPCFRPVSGELPAGLSAVAGNVGEEQPYASTVNSTSIVSTPSGNVAVATPSVVV